MTTHDEPPARWQRAHLIDVQPALTTAHEPDNLRRVVTSRRTGYLELRYVPRSPQFNPKPTTDEPRGETT